MVRESSITHRSGLVLPGGPTRDHIHQQEYGLPIRHHDHSCGNWFAPDRAESPPNVGSGASFIHSLHFRLLHVHPCGLAGIVRLDWVACPFMLHRQTVYKPTRRPRPRPPPSHRPRSSGHKSVEPNRRTRRTPPAGIGGDGRNNPDADSLFAVGVYLAHWKNPRNRFRFTQLGFCRKVRC